jgi:hypothetical protein
VLNQLASRRVRSELEHFEVGDVVTDTKGIEYRITKVWGPGYGSRSYGGPGYFAKDVEGGPKCGVGHEPYSVEMFKKEGYQYSYEGIKLSKSGEMAYKEGRQLFGTLTKVEGN